MLCFISILFPVGARLLFFLGHNIWLCSWLCCWEFDGKFVVAAFLFLTGNSDETLRLALIGTKTPVGRRWDAERSWAMKFHNRSIMAAHVVHAVICWTPVVCLSCMYPVWGIMLPFFPFLRLYLSAVASWYERRYSSIPTPAFSLFSFFLSAVPAALYLSLCHPPLLCLHSLLILPLHLLRSQAPFLCHFPAVGVSRRDVAVRLSVYIEDGLELRCWEQTWGTR